MFSLALIVAAAAIFFAFLFASGVTPALADAKVLGHVDKYYQENSGASARMCEFGYLIAFEHEDEPGLTSGLVGRLYFTRGGDGALGTLASIVGLRAGATRTPYRVNFASLAGGGELLHGVTAPKCPHNDPTLDDVSVCSIYDSDETMKILDAIVQRRLNIEFNDAPGQMNESVPLRASEGVEGPNGISFDAWRQCLVDLVQ